MNERLRVAVAAAERLSDHDQDEIAQAIEEMTWARLMADPRTEAVLDDIQSDIARAIAQDEIADWPEPTEQAL